ncbi:protein of unknown function DUF610, YibQ [Magnetococcus marinus MC-1]|uniref:Divergent polysaccharide deacetylase family protein n=1 Tax=Magnetococcus marinus (strain ATCC BAA-1437 / JCM 17883 / MC-1) TaxID=156889 RepID=A0LDF0_MAGMM|nr:protein of unknown function DUF610, YibQ [Magnetococcus marinus MC-1]
MGFLAYLWVAGPWAQLEPEYNLHAWAEGSLPRAELRHAVASAAVGRTDGLEHGIVTAALQLNARADSKSPVRGGEAEPIERVPSNPDTGQAEERLGKAVKGEPTITPTEVPERAQPSQANTQGVAADSQVEEEADTVLKATPSEASSEPATKAATDLEQAKPTPAELEEQPSVEIEADGEKGGLGPSATPATQPLVPSETAKAHGDDKSHPKSESKSDILYEEHLSEDLDKPEPPAVVEKKPVPAKHSHMVKIAVIIDDLGYNGGVGRGIVSLPADITLAVLPGGPYSRQLVNMAHKKGQEIILHQPMQPQGYPRVNPGPGALLEGMDADEIAEVLNHNLERFPEVVGINNHMGSALTENRVIMNDVMKVLVKRELYFIDSRTSPRSVAYRAALSHGVPRAKRSVFLDNKRTVAAILKRLQEAEEIAKRSGSAIAIGHPYGVTLQALKQWLPGLQARGIVVVRASNLLVPESSRKWFKPASP